MAIRVLDHPLAGHLLTQLRDASTPPTDFRAIAKKLTLLLALESTRLIRVRSRSVVTPVQSAPGTAIDQALAIVPVLRAGLGMVDPFLDLFPDVAVGYIGLERDEETAIARRYYAKLPNLAGKFCLCLDPMLATGGSAAQAISFMKSQGAESIAMVSVVSAPEGVERLATAHPDVDIVTAAIDDGLNDRRYIVPGLGDFGDRLYATP